MNGDVESMNQQVVHAFILKVDMDYANNFRFSFNFKGEELRLI